MALHWIDTEGGAKAGKENHACGGEWAKLTKAVTISIDVLADEIEANNAPKMRELACSAPTARKNVRARGALAEDYAVAWAWGEPENWNV